MSLPTGGRLDWSGWLYGLGAGFITGGSGAVIAGGVVSLNDPSRYNLKTGDLYLLMASIFVVNGILTMFAYLHQNPLPPVVTVSSVETTTQRGAPTVVVEKVETTTTK